MNVYWHKLKENARIPSKRDEDVGYDIYSTDEHDVLLMPHEKRLFPTGLAAAADPGYWLLAYDRGSTGAKGIHTHCGIIDNGYRGEIFICLCNDNDYPVKFTYTTDHYYKSEGDFYYVNNEEKCGPIAYYPLTKAIAQIIIMPQIESASIEMQDEDAWQMMCNTERGETKLGQSGK